MKGRSIHQHDYVTCSLTITYLNGRAKENRALSQRGGMPKQIEKNLWRQPSRFLVQTHQLWKKARCSAESNYLQKKFTRTRNQNTIPSRKARQKLQDMVKSTSPCFCMTERNLITTLEEGRMRTCRLPRFSALNIFLRASLRTLMRTMVSCLTSQHSQQQGYEEERGTRPGWDSLRLCVGHESKRETLTDNTQGLIPSHFPIPFH